MPTFITFFYHGEHYEKPTMTVHLDGTVTEHGVADLRHKSLDARADALIAIADPAFRATLADEWARARATFA